MRIWRGGIGMHLRMKGINHELMLRPNRVNLAAGQQCGNSGAGRIIRNIAIIETRDDSKHANPVIGRQCM